MTDALRSKALAYVVDSAAHENLGIYPQAVRGGDKPYEKRTEWMEGWNAAVIQHTEISGQIGAWIGALSAGHKRVVEDALLAGQVEVHAGKSTVSLLVNCNDTFYWGCADAEEITLEELPALEECYSLSPKYGGELWACRKRGMRPQAASYRECYPSTEWHLFDAAGPERDDPDGKRRPNFPAQQETQSAAEHEEAKAK